MYTTACEILHPQVVNVPILCTFCSDVCNCAGNEQQVMCTNYHEENNDNYILYSDCMLHYTSASVFAAHSSHLLSCILVLYSVCI